MARIPDPEVERIKREVPIRSLVEGEGVKLSGRGDNLMGLCPFHADKSPSLVVSPKKNVWHCLGACQAGGSVIDWVMKSKDVGFREAVAELEPRLGPFAASPSSSVAPPDTAGFVANAESDQALLRRVVSFYHRTLKEGGNGLSYLQSRGLGSAAMIDAFQIGLSDRSLSVKLPDKRTKEGAAIRGQLQRLGVLRGSGHEHFRGSVVIPVMGEEGEIFEMYGRKLRDDLPESSSTHLYLPRRPDGRRGVFNLPGLKSSKEVVLCEALLDALTFWCAGITHVTSAYGVEGFTAELLEAFVRHGVKKVLIAYDRDEAGDKAAARLAPELAHRGLEVFRVQFPKGMDANAYAGKVKPATKALEAAVRGAQWVAGERPVVVPDTLEPPHDPITGELLPASPEPVEETPPLAASSSAIARPSPPAPAPTTPDVLRPDHRKEGEARFSMGDRQWRLRGLRFDVAPSTLRLNVHVSKEGLYYVETFDLYNARQRPAFVQQASAELGVDELVIKSDLGRLLAAVEQLIEEERKTAEAAKAKAPMSEDERTEALALLRDPRLLERVVMDFDKCGMVGEETNKLVAYLAAVSRKLEAPLAVVIQSSSAAGKSSLMDAVLRLVPEEERVHFSAMTGQSLFYMGENDLTNKILAIAEEQGAQQASYALKLLQSDGQLSIASPTKDPVTGRIVTIPYHVKGPVMLFMTTTAVDVDEELLNRCLVLTVDEGAEQTAAIHRRQREAQTLEGLLDRRSREHVMRLHQNAQRLLEPLMVVNPFAPKLSFDHRRTRARRDHVKYLTLIRAVAFLHQHQRPVRTVQHLGQVVRYIEATEADVAMADRLSRAVLGANDELPAQTRRVLAEIDALVSGRAEAEGVERSSVRFTRRDIREHMRLSHTQVSVHVQRLEALEYLVVHGGGGKRRAVYELARPPADLLEVAGADLQGGQGVLKGVCRPLEGGGGLQEKLGDSGEKSHLAGAKATAKIRARAANGSYPHAAGVGEP